MPRWVREFAVMAGAALVLGDYVGAVASAASCGNEAQQFASVDETSPDDKGQGHVDFAVDVEDQVGTERGEGHVDFSIDPTGGHVLGAELLGAGEIVLPPAEGDGGGFRVTLKEDGTVEVNGEGLAMCDPALGARITLAWGGGATVVAVVDADGALCAAERVLGFAPESVRVAAAEIRALSILRQ